MKILLLFIVAVLSPGSRSLLNALQPQHIAECRSTSQESSERISFSPRGYGAELLPGSIGLLALSPFSEITPGIRAYPILPVKCGSLGDLMGDIVIFEGGSCALFTGPGRYCSDAKRDPPSPDCRYVYSPKGSNIHFGFCSDSPFQIGADDESSLQTKSRCVWPWDCGVGETFYLNQTAHAAKHPIPDPDSGRAVLADHGSMVEHTKKGGIR